MISVRLERDVASGEPVKSAIKRAC